MTDDTNQWLAELLGGPLPDEGNEMKVRGQSLIMRKGILRASTAKSSAQAQTESVFGYKWARRDTYDSAESLKRMREWLVQRYGQPTREPWWNEYGERPLVLDAGCGSSMSALELFEGAFNRMRYVGVDISEAVDTAKARFAERGASAAFVQADLLNLPFAPESFDIIFSEGVLHHTDSTERALRTVSAHLKPGGRIMFYVYRRKGPIREFTDDYIRDKLKGMPEEQAWKALEPLTRLGIALGELNVTVNVPEKIDLLDIPAGPIDVQRLFYWHVFKAFYHPNLTLDEANHINFDWYTPTNAHRQSLAELRSWCASDGLAIEREIEEPAGITIIARKTRNAG